MKEKVRQELQKRTKNHAIQESEVFTAVAIAESLGISRNTVSQYLNQLVKNGKVIKINTRPVYFFDKEILETIYSIHFDSFEYPSFHDFNQRLKNTVRDFEKLIGYNNSLHTVVEHCKAAISYPGMGLPILIYGPTGTGKSMIASLMYEYALNEKIISKEKRFIAVNCSEYANNPELLTANLFGYVKGAYTGAEEDNPGLIALADGGILFLDEVHCLKAECQEKLFFFMDKGMYHKVGDNDNWYHSKCHLVFATTEEPQNALLKTLLRRIPITVIVPSLKERPLVEKKQLIYTILKKESERLRKPISISNIAYHTLMDYEFSGNVGEMKNALKATCATAFLAHNDKQNLEINMYDLPDYFFTPSTSVQVKAPKNSDEMMFDIEQLVSNIENSTPLLHLYDNMLKQFSHYTQNKIDFTSLIEEYTKLLDNYINFVVYKNRYRNNTNDTFLLKVLDKIYSIVMNKYSLNVPNSEIQVFSKIISDYTRYTLDAKVWTSFVKNEVDALLQLLKEKVPRAYNIANEVVNNVALNLDLELDDLMSAIFTVSFISDEKNSTSTCAGLILAHGYSTASSIANTVNRILGEYVFDGIDMQIDLSMDKVAMLADEYLKRKNSIEELILLVDMGSLEEIYKRMRPIANCNIALMNNVSTAMALEAGNGLLHGKSVQDTITDIKQHYTLTTHYIQGIPKKNAIITICATGFGTAQKFSELLNSSMPKRTLDVIAYDYQSLVENGIEDVVFDRYNVRLMVGTLNPNIEKIDFISVEELMMDEGLDHLCSIMQEFLEEEEVAKFRSNIMKNFTLANIVNHLTILNAEKVIDDVEEIVEEMEHGFDCELDTTRKAGLYIHISCLIERLILKNEINRVEHQDEMVQRNKEYLRIMKQAFSGVEMRYSVDVPDAELLYILNYFKNM